MVHVQFVMKQPFKIIWKKYFGFRKAYCKLHVLYRFPLNIIVKILYPIRSCINNGSKLGSLICGVLKMEEYRRKCE